MKRILFLASSLALAAASPLPSAAQTAAPPPPGAPMAAPPPPVQTCGGLLCDIGIVQGRRDPSFGPEPDCGFFCRLTGGGPAADAAAAQRAQEAAAAQAAAAAPPPEPEKKLRHKPRHKHVAKLVKTRSPAPAETAAPAAPAADAAPAAK